MATLLIVDGNSIINRAYYGIRPLTNREGLHTNGIYGFLNIFFKHMEELAPDYAVVTFDLKAPTFRHLRYEAYKAQRKGMPDELAEQMPVLKEVLRAMHVAILEKEGYEADDLIGTVSRLCDEQQVACYIVTGDKDDLQLASDNTTVLLTTTRSGQTQTEPMDGRAVFEKYGVTPTEFIDVKGLMGDTSDNIPGVKGIGEKTAFALIAQAHSIEELYRRLPELSVTNSVRQKLEDGRDMAALSKELATIDRQVPIDTGLEAFAVQPYDGPVLSALLERLEFKSFLKKLELAPAATESAFAPAEILEDLPQLAAVLQTVGNRFVYYLWEEDGQPGAIAFLADGKAYLSRFGFSVSVEAFQAVFEAAEIEKISHDIKKDIMLLHGCGIEYKGIGFDTAIAAYLLDPARSAYPVNDIYGAGFGGSLLSEEAVLGKGKNRIPLRQAEEEPLCRLAGQFVGALPPLMDYEKETLEAQGQTALYETIELPLIRVLADMQLFGFTVDKESLAAFSKTLGERIRQLEADIYTYAGEEFNINSPKQLGPILFEKLGLPAGKKTKTGYSTGAEVLEKLRGEHPIVELLLEYRQLTKLKSTYTDGLAAVISPRTGKIHSTFNQTVTATGRISSTEPNLQNIPVRLALGREMRKMFTASGPDYVLVDADYSQIELRVLAHIAQDANMIAAFRADADIHAITASQVFHVPLEEVTSQMRSNAKAVNFGIVYGIGDFSLAQDLHITKKEAKQYIDGYLEHYPGVRSFMEQTVADAKEKGYVTTLSGRRRYIPELQASNFNLRAFGERVAMNAPIQGTAADIIKIAMVNVSKRLKAETKDSRLILQVHDELIVEAHQSEVEQVKKILLTEMEGAYKLAVPLKADLEVGFSWYDTK